LAGLGFTARHNLVHASGGAFELTPSVSVGAQPQLRNSGVESVWAGHLKEGRMGVERGRRASTRSSQPLRRGHISDAFVERVIRITNNRSNASVAATYAMLKESSRHVVSRLGK